MIQNFIMTEDNCFMPMGRGVHLGFDLR